MDLNELLELNERAKTDGKRYPRQRDLYHQLHREEGRHFIGIAGPRGAGKTILLRQFASEDEEAFYLSADVLEPGTDLVATLKMLNERYGYRTFLIDEIHFLSNYPALLKQLFDFFDPKVIFTSSVALALQASAHDLSRRVRILTLRSFSYREYLRFSADKDLPSISVRDLIDEYWTPGHLRAGQRFNSYLTGGILPYSLEEPDPLPLLANILEKVVTRDIPAALSLTFDELDRIRLLLKFIGHSTVDGINYSSISRNIGITKYKAAQYVECLERSFILHRVMPAGSNVMKEPKILLAPPYRLLYRTYEDAVGGLREDFVAESLAGAGIPFRYLKSTRGRKTPDFLVEDGGEKIVIEIGGRGKGRSQFKGVAADRKLVFAHGASFERNRLPLFLLGYLARQ